MREHDPLTGVPPSRHPFQFYALAACALSGFLAIIDFGQPQTLVETLPEWTVSVWGWTVCIGGVLGIAAAWWKDRVTGLLMERIALGAIAGACAIYGTVVYAVAGSTATFISIQCLNLFIAGIWRIRHITRELAILGRWIERNTF